MSSVSDEISYEDFLNNDTDHTSPLHSPLPLPKSKPPPIRPKPAKLSPTNTSPNVRPETILDVRAIANALPVDVPGGSRCVIAVDFGTTFTGVAIAVTASKIARTKDIELMQDFGEKMSNQLKVPSVISYSLSSNGEKQWGMDIAVASVTMVNTKMQLDIQDTRLDELETTLQILQGTGFLDFNHVKNVGTIAGYTWKSPVDVATDYLTRVCERVCLAIPHVIPRAETDIVVTVPVDWSDRATELTYKAFDRAGFNKKTFPKLKDMILVTEPEAASYYTALENREAGNNVLKKDEIFILCDAGGGTVDVIAFVVKSLDPHLELVRVSEPSKNKCGGSFVDANFKGWLRQAIGKENFAKLDKENALRPISTHTSESGPMRELMARFDAKKKKFSHKTVDLIKIDLPPPLDNLHVEGRVDQGALMIHPQEMGNIFKYCVNKVVELIDDLAERVTMDNHRRIKNCFLVGGFGESPYLQELLRDALDLRSIELRAPKSKNSWTAAAMGAVVYGIEKERMAQVKCMHGVTSNYGIKVNAPTMAHMMASKSSVHDPITNEKMTSTFSWLIRRGDLIMSNATKRADKWFRYVFRTRDERKLKLQIYEYSDPDDKLPVDFLTSQNEVETMGIVDCDMSRFPISDFGTGLNERTRSEYHTADLRCKMSVSLDVLEVEVLFKRAQVGYTKITLGTKAATAAWSMPTDQLGLKAVRSTSSNFDHNYMNSDDTPPNSPPGRWS